MTWYLSGLSSDFLSLGIEHRLNAMIGKNPLVPKAQAEGPAHRSLETRVSC